MRDSFEGFLLLRLVAFLALLVVLAVVLGIRSLARGSEVVGIVLLAGAVAVGTALGALVARRSRPPWD